MKRREAKEEIERVLAENIVEERVFQLKPWTCYTAKSVVGEGEFPSAWVYKGEVP